MRAMELEQPESSSKKIPFNKSQSFILPCIGISSYDMTINGFKESYMGDYNITQNDSWGEYIFLLFNKTKLTEKFLDMMRKNECYFKEYSPREGELMIALTIPEYHRKNIVQPFLKGKYSDMDRSYVVSNYDPFVYDRGEKALSRNWMILNKHPFLRKEWELVIGVDLPEDAEVWSRPVKNDEIYNYREYAISKGANPSIEVW